MKERASLSGPLGRALLTLGVTEIAAWGSLFYSMALVGPRIAAETGWSQALVYGGFSLALVASGLSAPAAGRLIDRHGGRPVMASAALLGAAGLAVLAVSHGPLGYLLGWAAIGVAMAGTLYDPAFATLAQVAGPQTRRAISLLTLAGGFASTVSWPVTLWLLGQMDWRSVLLVHAAGQALLCAPLLAFALPAASAGSVVARTTETALPRPSLLRDMDWTAFGLFALVIAAHGFVTSALSVHLVRLLDVLGMTEAQAVLAGAFIGPAQVGARLLELLFGARLSALGLGVCATVLLPVAFAVLAGLPAGTAVAVAFSLVYGASNGLVTIARGVVPFALFRRDRYGEILGLLSTPALVAKASAPVLFALVVADHRAGPALMLCSALALLAAAAMLALATLRRERPAPAP